MLLDEDLYWFLQKYCILHHPVRFSKEILCKILVSQNTPNSSKSTKQADFFFRF